MFHLCHSPVESYMIPKRFRLHLQGFRQMIQSL